MEYMNVKQASARWGISDRRVQLLCQQGKIRGARKQGRTYAIPSDAVKPADGRTLRGFTISQQFSALFSRIDGLQAALDQRRPLTEGELQRMQDEFLVEFTFNSNAIEGNTLTLKETALVLEGITIDQKPLKEHLEAVGHRDAFLYVMQLVTDKQPISEQTIKHIHSLVPMDRPRDRGVYRNIPVRIMGAFQEPPQPYLLPVRMERLVSELANTKRHPLESSALFHLEFEGIHPFIDGNGRTGRLILNLMLMRDGYPPVDIKFADRKRYYECFDKYFKDQTVEPMVTLIAGYVEERLKQYARILE